MLQSPYFWPGLLFAVLAALALVWGLTQYEAARLLAQEAAQGLARQTAAYWRAHPDEAKPLIADVYAAVPALLRRYVPLSVFTEWVMQELAKV